MNFYKILSVLIIILSVFSSNSYSMQEDEDTNEFFASAPRKKDMNEKTPIIKEEESCSHWGLSHWVSGIREYLQKCFCCEVKKEDGRYVRHYKREIDNVEYRVITSDCCCDENHFCGKVLDEGCPCCAAILCSPFMGLQHLCCLPIACCECSEKGQEHSYLYGGPPRFYPTYTKPSTDEDIIREYSVYYNDPPHVFEYKRGKRPMGYRYRDQK